jgi:predicted phage-related endonuclease
MVNVTMEANSKANISETKQEKLKELHAQQVKLKELQDELGVIESKIKNNEKLSSEDTKFIGELGWLSAAAVAIASIAASI